MALVPAYKTLIHKERIRKILMNMMSPLRFKVQMLKCFAEVMASTVSKESREYAPRTLLNIVLMKKERFF